MREIEKKIQNPQRIKCVILDLNIIIDYFYYKCLKKIPWNTKKQQTIKI